VRARSASHQILECVPSKPTCDSLPISSRRRARERNKPSHPTFQKLMVSEGRCRGKNSFESTHGLGVYAEAFWKAAVPSALAFPAAHNALFRNHPTAEAASSKEHGFNSFITNTPVPCAPSGSRDPAFDQRMSSPAPPFRRPLPPIFGTLRTALVRSPARLGQWCSRLL
jgi:hypothetical protein